MVAKTENRSHPRGGRSQGSPAKGNVRGGAVESYVNLHVVVEDRGYHLHKFQLLSRSGRLNRLAYELLSTERGHIDLSGIPGGARVFEHVVRLLYGRKLELSPHNVATLRCAAEYLEMTEDFGSGNLVTKTENYLTKVVMGSWRDCISVLETCSELVPMADDLEIVSRCIEPVARKCSNDLHDVRRSFSPGAVPKETQRGRWFDDICSLSITVFSRVINAVSKKGMNPEDIGAAVEYYAHKCLQLTKGPELATMSKTESRGQASILTSMGSDQQVLPQDTTKTLHEHRAVLQGIVNLLPFQLNATSVKFLLKLLRVACSVNASSFCKTELAKRIASQLEKAEIDDLLIPVPGESTCDLDIVQQIVEFYLQDQIQGNSTAFSPSSVSRSSVSRSSSFTSSSRSKVRSLSSSSSSSLSGSRTTTGSWSDRSISGSGVSDSSISSTSLISSSETGSFVSTSSETSTLSSRSPLHSRTNSVASTETSSLDLSNDESEKLEGKFCVNEGGTRKAQLPPTTTNCKVAQLLETYLEKVGKDSNVTLAKFITLSELIAEFPRDSDDFIYKAIDAFLRAHPTLTELERKELCSLMDTGSLSLSACMHAASNEHLPLRVIVQVLFNEQIKLRNAITVNNVINNKDVDGGLENLFSATSSESGSSSDLSESSTSSSSSTSVTTTSRLRSPSISSANALNLVIPSPTIASENSSKLLGGLSTKETLRFVLAEIESLRNAAQEIENIKSRLIQIDALQLEINSLSTRFQEMAQDYSGMTQQVEELTKNTKHKSGWSSGWRKVTKSFQSKDPALMEHPRFETTPLPRTKLSEHMDLPALSPLRTSKSDILLPKTPRADTTLLTKTPRAPDVTLHPKTPRANSLSIPKTPKAELTSHPKTLGSDSVPISKIPKSESSQCQKTIVPNFKATSVVNKIIPLKQENDETQSSLEGVHEVLKVDTPTSNSKRSEASSVQFRDRCKEDYNITNHRSLHVGDEHRKQRSRSTSPDFIHQHKHRHESDSVSVASTSSYSTTSTTLSNRSGHVYRGRDSHNGHRKDYFEDRQDRSKSRTASHNHHRRHDSNSRKSERSLGHERHEREFSAERSHRSSQHRLEHHGPSHLKHRQKEMSGHRSTSNRSQNEHDVKDHHYMDSHFLHISTDTHSSTPVYGSGHQRFKEGSVSSYHGREGSEHHSSHRSSLRNDHYKGDLNRHSSQHQRRGSRHRRKEFSESDASGESTKRKYR